jgi:hypothetical protein
MPFGRITGDAIDPLDAGIRRSLHQQIHSLFLAIDDPSPLMRVSIIGCNFFQPERLRRLPKLRRHFRGEIRRQTVDPPQEGDEGFRPATG